MKAQWISFLAQRRPDFALTLAYNHQISIRRLRSDLRDLHARLDRHLHGRRYNRLSRSSRSWFAGFPENLDSNAHVHLLLRVDEARHQALESLFPGTRGAFWNRLAPLGTHVLARITDAEGWAAYSTKDLDLDGNIDWIDSDEFLPADSCLH